MVRGLFAGLATLDVVSHVEAAPGPDEKVTASWQLLAGGGPALNAAVTFAALGGEATLLTRIGGGPAADLIRADLRACGVRVLDAAGPATTPPVSGVTVEADGTRRVVGLDAAGGGGTIPTLPEVDVVLFDGHHPDLAHAALTCGQRVPRVLDAGRWKPQMSEIIPRCTHVLASAAFRLDGREEPVEERVLRLSTLLDGDLDTVAAVTAGAGGIEWVATRATGARGSDGAARMRGTTVPPTVEAVDTLGAGDALHGAYAWALAEGRADPSTVAAAVASWSCEVRGTRAWLPLAREVADRASR